jgi:PAS domain S-box-containing protein
MKELLSKHEIDVLIATYDLLKLNWFDVDFVTSKITSSKNIKELLEIEETHADLTFKDYQNYLADPDKETSAKNYEVIQRTKQPFTAHRKIITPKGNARYIEVFAKPIFNSSDKLIGLVGLIKDNTLKKEQEIRLIEAEKLLTSNAKIINFVHENLNMGAYTLDLEKGTISTDFNYIAFFDLDNEHLIFTLNEYLNLLTEEDKNDTYRSVENVLTNNVICTKIRTVITPNGITKYLEVSAQAFYQEGKSAKIVGTFRDVTAKKNQELQLKITEQKLSDTLTNLKNAQELLSMSEYVINLSASSIETDYNLSDLYELENFKAPLSLQDYFKYISPEEIEDSKYTFKKIIEQGIPYKKERKIITAKGNEKFIELTGNPIYHNGKVVQITGTLRDITFRKRLEQKLLNTEIKLLEAQAILRMGTFELNVITNKIEHSLELSEILEFSEMHMMTSVQEFINYVHDDDKQIVAEYIHALLEGRMVEEVVERKMITQKGNIRFLEFVSRTIVVDNVVTKLFGTFRDVTEKKIQEIWTEKNQARLREASIALKSGTFHYNIKSKMIGLSDEVMTILENRIAKYIHVADFFKFIPTTTRKLFFKNFILLLESKSEINQIIKLKFDDNTYRYIEIVGSIASDSTYYSGTFRDITQQHEKDIALSKSEERFRQLFENTPSLYFIIDMSGVILSINQYGADYLGYKKEDLIGKHHDILFQMDDRTTVTKNLETLKLKPENVLQWEVRKRKKSGEIIWVKETARISTNQNDEPIYLLVCEDITSDVHNRLLVNRKQEELIKAKEKAEVAVVEKQQFTSIMSHEIRTPLNAVIGMTNILLMQEPRADQVNDLNTLKFAAENLLVLVNDILDFSKIEAGKVMLENIPIDLYKLIQNFKSSYQYRTDEKGIFINTIIDQEIPHNLLGDAMRLSQILNNLLSNAVKFTEKGFVEISILKLVHINNDEVKVRFEVSDTGIGIAPDKQQSIFQMFSQAHSDTTRKFGGTGLGLTITRKLLQLFNSEIKLISELNKGTTFYFDIVFKKSTAANTKILNNTLAEGTSKYKFKNVLLVEDNEVNRQVTTKFLMKWRLNVDTANDGLEAIKKIEQYNYDLILMDIYMPEMNGIEACKIIRNHANEQIKSTPIIALTAATMDNEKSTLIELGMNDYISKPFNPSDLYNKIYQHIRQDE